MEEGERKEKKSREKKEIVRFQGVDKRKLERHLGLDEMAV